MINKNKVIESKYLRTQKEAWFFIGISVIPLMIIVIIPMILLYYTSMTNFEIGTSFFSSKFIGLQNFIRLFKGRHEFNDALQNTFFLAITATAVELFLGFFIALLVDSLKRIKGFWFSIIMFPMVVTPVIIGLIWKLMLNSQHGVVNWILNKTIGWAPVWFSTNLSLFSILLIDVWQWTPFICLTILSGLASLENDAIEAALVDGASPFRVLIHIKLPLLRGIILLAVLFRVIDILKIFDIIFITTMGGPGSTTLSLSVLAYKVGFYTTGYIGRASATAVFLTIIVTIISFLIIKQIQKFSRER